MKKVPSTPSNNKTKQAPKPPEVGTSPNLEEKKPESFSISMAGVDELVACLNETVQSKYVKQVIF